MSEFTCISCRRPKATLHCEVCEEPVCKGCVQFLPESTFSFLKTIPEELSHASYCSHCYGDKVVPALESYNETMDRARGIYIFFNTRKRPIPLVKRSRETVRVDDCDDRNETILRLAFLAADQGYNAVIETEVESRTVRNAGYEKSIWKGSGVPARVDAEKLERFNQDRD